MTTLNEIGSKLTEMLTENKNEIQNYTLKIETADESIQNANDQLKESELSVNVDDYNTAKNNIWSAKHAKELFIKTKSGLEKNPIIDRKQYKSLLTEIEKTANNGQEELNKKAIELIKKMHVLADESNGITKKANELMNTLQRNVYREPEGKISNGDGTTTWSSDKTYRVNISVGGFYNNRIKGTQLSKLAGETSNQVHRSWL